MAERMYIELLKQVLTDTHRLKEKEYEPVEWIGSILGRYLICKQVEYDAEKRREGKDWPAHAETMIGMKRLQNIEYLVNDVIRENIPGDLIETGVWRGGAVIFMRALLMAYGVNDKTVWVADSFEGLPEPEHEQDEGDIHYKHKILAVSIDKVKENFRKYGLLDDQVKFLKGWFKDTLPDAPIKKLCLMRLDGDMYESTMDALENLYPKLSHGGFVIVDDWGAVPGCRQAVEDYRELHGINNEIKNIDWTGIYWQK